MKYTINKIKLLIKTALLFSLFSCGGGGGSSEPEEDTQPVKSVNQFPVVDAGSDVHGYESSILTLNASASDQDGFISHYQWRQTEGVSVNIIDPQSPMASIELPSVDEQQVLTFEITVTDNEKAIVSDSVNVVVIPVIEPLTVEIISKGSVIEGGEISLQAKINSADEQQLTFLWQQLSGETVELVNATEQVMTFTAPSVTQLSHLTFQVNVSDNNNNQTLADVSIAVTNIPELNITGLSNDTGIDTCSDESSTELDCSNEVFAGQDGTHGRDISHHDNSNGHAGFDFTKISADGSELSTDANEWSCVRDNVTGFIWEVKTVDGGLQDNQHTYSWFENDQGFENGQPNLGVCSGSDCDTSSYVQAINQQGLCGANDWQVPTIRQLHGLIDYSRNQFGVATSFEYFPNTLASEYWSSTLFSTPLWGWSLNFYDATMKQTLQQAPKNLRLIRSRSSN
ncbi:DUF1566 domain-containing protein [Thalassotalea nanhaiensis]|uniref:DUF1566 domain-containing protein n=1 Tax=Thalassotalea nanhaiensis TaxID=3065648 RepID=A0ABY9TE95_9GAMM|nr:DUF1566 domain-containing protein [Colwelliaceae bacterium SQ345]